MTSGYFVVQFPSGMAPVWLTNINGQMWLYQTTAGRWLQIPETQIVKEV